MAKDCTQTNSSMEPFPLGHKFDLHTYIILPIPRIMLSTYIRGSSMLSPHQMCSWKIQNEAKDSGEGNCEEPTTYVLHLSGP